MKKFGTIICAMLLCVCFLLAGCGTKLEMPTGDVKSNGGNTVVVGDYVYFANTYVDTASLTTGANDEGKVKENAIYRVKTENKQISTDENGVVQNLEEVKSKIAGFATSNMFVKGSYLYFTSPNAHKSGQEDEQGKDRFDLTTLFRCKLDGTGLSEIMTTQSSAGKFYLAKQGEKDVLFVFDENKLYSFEIADNLGGRKVLEENIADIVFPEEFGKQITELYYTADLTEQDGKNEGVTGNKLFKYTLADDKSTPVRQVVGETISLVAYDTNRLYYTRNVDSITSYYSNDFKSSFEVGEIQHTFVDSSKVTEFYAFGTSDNGDVLPVVFVFNSKLFMQPVDSNPVVLANASVTVEFISGEYIYYTTSDGIYRKSYKTPSADAVQITDKSDIKAGTADFDGKFVYFYAKAENNSTDNFYMHRADAKKAELGHGMKTECISYVVTEDLVEEEPETQE